MLWMCLTERMWKKSDIEKLIGAWRVDTDRIPVIGVALEFYEPNDKGSTYGNLEYTLRDGDTMKGGYNYHESSKKIEIDLYDFTNTLNEYTRQYTFVLEFEDNNHFRLENERYTYELIRVDN